MTSDKKISERNWLTILALFLVLSLSVVMSVYIYGQIKSDIYKSKEVSVVSSSNIFSRYIIDTYELYYNSGTLKFQEVMGQIGDINKDFRSFQIIDMDGNMLFDSGVSALSTNEKKIKSELDTNILSSSEVYTKKSGNRIEYIVVPHIDDWGNHKYSVKYHVNYQDANEKLDRFKVIFMLVAGGVLAVMISIFTFLIYDGKYRLAKQHAKDMDSINNIKDEFMVLVSHNLRTPLSVIKGYMSFITDPNSPKEEIAGDIVEMEIGVQKLSSLVEDIVFATSILSGEEKFSSDEVSLEEVVEDIRLKYDSQIKAKSLKFRYASEGEATFVGDRKALGKVLDNLVENAIKFSVEGGSVDVRVTNVSELKVTVFDTGVGIEEDRLDSIVGFFHRGSDVLKYNFEGEGLGLYLTNLIVKHYNGQMHVTSEKDKGSTFEVILKKES